MLDLKTISGLEVILILRTALSFGTDHDVI